MKQIFLAAIAVFVMYPGSASAGGGNKGEKNGVNWMTLDEVQVAMQREPKKVFVDVYTDWCGWCKVMDRKTFSNPEVAAYMNKNFYAVKFNAESRDSIRFGGRMWGVREGERANDLAIEMLRGQLSYPTSVVLDAGFQNPQAIPGYLDVPTIEVILHYLAENIQQQKIPFPEYQKAYKHTWKVLPEEAPATAAPMGH